MAGLMAVHWAAKKVVGSAVWLEGSTVETSVGWWADWLDNVRDKVPAGSWADW